MVVGMRRRTRTRSGRRSEVLKMCFGDGTKGRDRWTTWDGKGVSCSRTSCSSGEVVFEVW